MSKSRWFAVVVLFLLSLFFGLGGMWAFTGNTVILGISAIALFGGLYTVAALALAIGAGCVAPVRPFFKAALSVSHAAGVFLIVMFYHGAVDSRLPHSWVLWVGCAIITVALFGLTWDFVRTEREHREWATS